MARIRTIKPEFWASEQVMECSPIARLLFIGLWNFCDDGGNHVDSDRTIKAEIFPGDDISSQDVRRLLDELSSNGLIALYSSNGKGFIHVTGWQHQKIDRPSYKHPAFPGDASPNVRRMIDEDSPPEGKGREGKGEEGDMTRQDASNLPKPRKRPIPADFGISERVTRWAAEKGYTRLPERLERFVSVAKAKGYQYIDWDEAFMNAIRDDWAKFGHASPATRRPEVTL